ncbi:MBL fold metallo-hydrolase [Fulvivirga lutimaris]|uniref:MBL fold metallo-hydrolase n=1 Tax=Fulvivirga lutimaris TaxID=1819566 RepID=UPI0012BB682F|nr:MBL fold metallo-hydrolase [Fulvivirga lutimaris]MTI38745.1 MBL fold metallo-hydrolase [Fulvivirga lutimaris]
MKITFLGTGTSQGIPVIACNCDVCTSLDFRDQRLRTSIHIEVEGKSFVIDTGPDFRQQMLRERINSLDGVIYTHEHKDHTAGLDDVRAYNFIQKKEMPIYATERVLNQLKMEYSYIFTTGKKYPGIPQIRIEKITNNPFEADGIKFTPIEVLHLKLPVLGFRINDFTYITDANYISEEEKEKIKGSKALVINALQKAEHISHFNFEQAVALAQELNIDHTYFTHLSHRMGRHSEVEKELPENISLAFDGQQIEL